MASDLMIQTYLGYELGMLCTSMIGYLGHSKILIVSGRCLSDSQKREYVVNILLSKKYNI